MIKTWDMQTKMYLYHIWPWYRYNFFCINRMIYILGMIILQHVVSVHSAGWSILSNDLYPINADKNCIYIASCHNVDTIFVASIGWWSEQNYRMIYILGNRWRQQRPEWLIDLMQHSKEKWPADAEGGVATVQCSRVTTAGSVLSL